MDPRFLDKVNMLKRQSIREIRELPANTPIPISYTGCKYRGLGMLRVVWEASLQYY